MGRETQPADAQQISRAKLLQGAGKVGVVAAIAGGTTAALAGPASATGRDYDKSGHTHHKRRSTVILDVDTKGFADFQGPASTNAEIGGGPFYVSGEILRAYTKGSGKRIGTFHCWGFISEAGDNAGTGVVSQEFEIDGMGKIQIQGVESDAPRAVTGGTGHFKNARGEGFPDLVMFDFMNTGKFRITFHLIGA